MGIQFNNKKDMENFISSNIRTFGKKGTVKVATYGLSKTQLENIIRNAHMCYEHFLNSEKMPPVSDALKFGGYFMVDMFKMA